MNFTSPKKWPDRRQWCERCLISYAGECVCVDTRMHAHTSEQSASLRGTHVHTSQRTHTYTHIHMHRLGSGREYTSRSSEGSLLPAVCGSAVSHTPLFLRNQCMHTTASGARSLARARASEQESRPSPRRDYKYVHAHTEMESAANALTYGGLLLREVGQRDTWLLCMCTHSRGIASARVRHRARARLSRASFFEFH